MDYLGILEKSAIDNIKELNKQDKMIDVMAKFIEERINECPYDFWIEAEKELNCKEFEEDYAKCWKQYFEKQVESEDKQC